MKKAKKQSIILNNFYILYCIFKISPGKVCLEIITQLFSKCKMYIFNIFYPLYVYQSIQNNKDFSVIAKQIIISMVVILFIDAFTNYYNSYKKPMYDIYVLEKINKDMFSKRVTLDYDTHENLEMNEKLNQVAVNINKTFIETQNSFLTCIFDTVYLIITLNLMVMIDRNIMGFVVLPVIVSFIFGNMVNKKQYHLNMDLLDEERKINYVKNTFYNRESSKEIKLTRISKPLIEFLNTAYNSSMKHIKNKGLLIGIQLGIMETLGRYIIYVGAFIYITYNVIESKKINIGEFYFLLYSIITLSWFMTSTIKNILLLGKNGLYINQYKEFCDLKTNIETTSGIKVQDSEDMVIEFRKVYFKYSNEERYVLEDINLKFSNKERIALVGYNGAGKTTIIKLVLRLYDVTKGEILLNGNNIKDYDIKEYRNIFGTVFQDFQIYEDKLSVNIAMDDEIDNKKIKTAARTAGIEIKIEDLEDQYDTVYSKEFDEKGVIFSGGENQKMAIARAFYNTKRIAIFDEPSSFLDPYAEKQILEKMMNNSNTQTTIFVSHRLSSATLADKVYYIENGKVLEEGSHDNLMQKKGKYYEVFQAQAYSYQ